MRKEVLCILGVLLGGCWAQAQQMPYGYAAPAYYPGYPQTAQAAPSGFADPAYQGYPQTAQAMPYNPGQDANTYAPSSGYAPSEGYGQNVPYSPPPVFTPSMGGGGGETVGALPEGEDTSAATLTRGLGIPNRAAWFSVDYLLAHLQRDRLTNPLVTQGNPADLRPGALGQPSTTILFGDDDYKFGTRHGVRVQAGVYLDSSRTFSVDAAGFYIFPDNLHAQFASDATGTPLIARPVINASNGQLRSFLTSFPGSFSGSTAVDARSELWGFETNARCEFDLAPSIRANVLGGFRFVRLNERLSVSDQLTPITPGAFSFLGATNFVSPPNSITDQDLFATTNNFYGVNLGSQVRWERSWLSLSAYGKVALGMTEEKLRIQGSTTLITPAGNQTAPGGILALPSNIGNYSRSVFGVVPEAGLTLGIEPIRHVRATVGYSFLYWNNVLRPGAQIDRIVNPGQVPTDSNFGVINAGPHPIVDLMDKSFRVHTLNVGLELYY